MNEWMSEWMNEWVSELVNEWVKESVSEWVSEWVNEWMNEWVSEWMNEWMTEWMNERMSEWVNEWVNEWMNEWLNEWTKEWMSEWVNEWMSEWMNEWMNRWWFIDWLIDWSWPAVIDPSFSQLVADMDDKLLANIRHNSHHLLHKLLPDITDHTSYNLRPRCHSFSLSAKTDSRNYINRMLLMTFVSSLHLYGCVMSICLLMIELLLKTDRRQTVLRRNVTVQLC